MPTVATVPNRCLSHTYPFLPRSNLILCACRGSMNDRNAWRIRIRRTLL